MKRKLSKDELNLVKNEFSALVAENNIDIENDIDSLIALSSEYAQSHLIDAELQEEDVLSIFDPDNWGTIEETNPDLYYSYDKDANDSEKEDEVASYYRTLDKDSFISEFKEMFQKNIQEKFEELFNQTESAYPQISSLLKEPTIMSADGLRTGRGKIKRMANTDHVDDAKSVYEFRVNSSGAKPTVYTCPDAKNNFIYLGNCSLKNDGDRKEDAKIQRAVRHYKQFLNLKDNLDAKYSVKIGIDL